MNEETSQSSYRVASDELRAFIERFERLDAEKKKIFLINKKKLCLKLKAVGMTQKFLERL